MRVNKERASLDFHLIFNLQLRPEFVLSRIRGDSITYLFWFACISLVLGFPSIGSLGLVAP